VLLEALLKVVSIVISKKEAWMKQSCWRYSRSIFNEVSEFVVYVLSSFGIQTIYADLNDQRPAYIV
jgi:hypothetical protein